MAFFLFKQLTRTINVVQSLTVVYGTVLLDLDKKKIIKSRTNGNCRLHKKTLNADNTQ
jgi:hypothetical protein